MIIIAVRKNKNHCQNSARITEDVTVPAPRFTLFFDACAAAPVSASVPAPASASARRRLSPALLLPAVFAVLLAACSKPAPPSEDVRPVRAVTLAAADLAASVEFSGDVRPRYESRLGFRVGGKISARKVDVGTVVKRGQVLMQLDPQDLRLGQAQAQANLRAAQTNLDLARAELKRYQDLRAQNFVAQAVLDQKAAAAHSSQATVEAARAALSEQANQTTYASLVSDTDGVVTAIDAEVGQVVQAGTPTVRVARTDEKEVVIGVPEDQVEALRRVSDVKVRLWADPNQSIPGKIREVSPMADAATRTYAVKVSVPPRDDVRLGMTAVVQMVSKAKGGDAQLRVPLSALYQDKGASSVWVIENGAVRLTPVQVGGVSGNDVLLTGGVRAGQAVVTAGVNLLKNGQKVRILTADVARRGDAEADAAGSGGAGGAANGGAGTGAVDTAPPAAASPEATPAATPALAGPIATGAAVAGVAAVGTAVAVKAAAKHADKRTEKRSDKHAKKQAKTQAKAQARKQTRKQVKKDAGKPAGKAGKTARRNDRPVRKLAAASTGAAR